MAKLTSADRGALPAEEFAEPKERKFPVEDQAHASNAKSRATQMLKRGLISDKQHQKIVAKANKVLGKAAVPNADEA